SRSTGHGSFTTASRLISRLRALSDQETAMTCHSRLISFGPRMRQWSVSTLAAASMMQAALAHAAPTLTGWASLPAKTTATGPTTGQFAGMGFGANSNLLPIPNAQAVQGFSAVLDGPRDGTYYVMPDNGFGAKTNSADALLRVYALDPDFRVWNGK